MNYTEFAEKMLIALYQETESGENPSIALDDLMKKYGLTANEAWLIRLTEEWEENSQAKVQLRVGFATEWQVEITGRGMREIESRFRVKDGASALLDPLPTGVTLSSGRVLVSDSPVTADFKGREGDFLIELGPETPTIDSSIWTGLPKTGVLTNEASQALKSALKLAEQALDQSRATNEERAQARAYIVAIQALADAPEPPADLIWHLVQRVNSIAGIASFFAALVALFAHA
jgi:hypothetical protein